MKKINAFDYYKNVNIAKTTYKEACIKQIQIL